MGCKYVKDFEFSTKNGYTGSAKGYAEGGEVDRKEDKKMIATAVHKHERAQHPGKPLTALKKGGKVGKYADGGVVPAQAAARPAMPPQSNAGGALRGLDRAAAVRGRPMPVQARGPAMAAGRDPRVPMLKKGGKVEKVMAEFGKGKLHSGSTDKVVTNPKQAIAIALSEERRIKK